MSLLAKNLPKVSREFALELRKMFPPITLEAGIDRDKLMISVGEQRVIQKILHISSNKVLSSKTDDIKPDVSTNTDNTTDKIIPEVQQQEESEARTSWFKRFTTRTAT